MKILYATTDRGKIFEVGKYMKESAGRDSSNVGGAEKRFFDSSGKAVFKAIKYLWLRS